MADRFVSTTGSNTSPYDTWAKAATTLTTAITGSAAGDRFILDAASPQADIAANTTYTFVGDAQVIASTNSGTATVTPTTMGTSAWLGASGGTSYSVAIAGAFKIYIYGVTLRISGAGNAGIAVNSSDGGHFELEDCYLWLGTTSGAAPSINIGSSGGASSNSYTKLTRATYRFGHVNQDLAFAGFVELFGGIVSSSGSAPTTLFTASNKTEGVSVFGCDISHVTSTLVAAQTGSSCEFRFIQSIFGSGVTVIAAQAPTNKSSAKVFVLDCASGDTHGFSGYYDAFGSVVSDTGIYFTSGAAAQSWKIVTTANCSYYTPFVTPWIPFYNSGTSAVTPYLEILRDGSATAYQDDEVWAEFAAKTTSGSTRATLYNDRMALAGTPANQAAGAGLGSWTGESGTAWSGKIDSGSSFTPAEVGDVSARVVVGEPSITVYVDPFVRS